MIKYNDYELLYLISEKNDYALEIMYKKYEPLIKKRIKDFKIKSRNREDYFQEGLWMLNIAIMKYDQNQRKTFNKYFDLILQRHFIHLLRSEKSYFYNTILTDNVELLGDCYYVENKYYQNEEDDITNFSNFEKEIFYYYKDNIKPREIAKVLNIPIKKVYDAICRIKKKSKKSKLS